MAISPDTGPISALTVAHHGAARPRKSAPCWATRTVTAAYLLGALGIVSLGTAVALEVRSQISEMHARNDVARVAEAVSDAERAGGTVAAVSMLDAFASADIKQVPTERRYEIAVWRQDGSRILGDDLLPSMDELAARRETDAGGIWTELKVDTGVLIIGREFEIGEVFTAYVGRRLTTPMWAGRAASFGLALAAGLFLISAVAAAAIARRRQRARASTIAAVLDRAALGDLAARVPVSTGPGELEEVAARINVTLGRLQNSSAAVRDWSAVAAHEMRGHLGQLAEVLRNSPTDLERLSNSMDDLLQLFDELLGLAELRADVDRHPESCRPDEVINAVTELYEPVAAEKGIRLDVTSSGTPTFGERWLLVRAIADLVDNAIRHAPLGSIIELTWQDLASGGVVIHVRDHGEGPGTMSLPDMMRRPWADGDAGHRIGLRTVEAIAVRHGGSFSIEDARPGLRASLRLPPPPVTRHQQGAKAR